jgi:hypothetical protein
MRALSLVLGVFCLAGCTGPDIIPIQGVVPMAVHPADTGVIARVPVDPVSASPFNTSAMKPESPQDHYDNMVRHGQLKEANGVGVGVMAGSQPCIAPGGVVAPPSSLSKPCGVAPLDDFSLNGRRR